MHWRYNGFNRFSVDVCKGNSFWYYNHSLWRRVFDSEIFQEKVKNGSLTV